MRCTDPEAVTPEDIVAYVDGDAPPRVVEHIRSCPSCTAEAHRYARTQGRLRQTLHRFDCPSPHSLGEYNLGLVSAEDRARIAGHVLECAACAAELRTLRSFMADEPPEAAGASAVGRLRRVIAALVTPWPRLAPDGLRGGGDEGTLTYRAEDVTISLSVSPGTRRGRFALVGLVVTEGAQAQQPVQPEAYLAASSDSLPGDRTEVDDLGNFAFDDVAPGEYLLELLLSDRSILVEMLRIGD